MRVHDDAESLELALIENMAREDLNPIEEARACALLVEELGLTREEIGRRVGRSRVAVSNLLRLLDLPDEALDMLARGELTEGHGRAILMAQGHDERRRLAREALAEGWNVRRTEAEARAAAGADPAGPVQARRTRPPGPGGRRFPPRRGVRAGARRRRQGDGARDRLQGRDDVRLARRGARAGRSPGRRRARLTPLLSPGHGRLAQSVRALL